VTFRTTLFIVLAAGCATAAEPADAPARAERFRATCRTRAGAAAKADEMVVRGRDGWRFLASELRHVGVGEFWGEAAAKVSRARNPKHADPIPAIVDFNDRLKKLGIELILMPVPPKAVVYPEMVSGELKDVKVTPRLDPQHERFYKLLGEKGVKMLDLTPLLVARRFDNAAGELYCERDSHWSGRACVAVARAIAAEIKERPWLEGIARREFVSETREVEITGDLARAPGDGPAKETLPLRFVGTRTDAGLTPVAPDRESPVLLLADSHGLVFHAGGDMHARGAGLADQFARELGFAPDVLAVRGSGATAARVGLYRRGRADPATLRGKKLVIWCFSAREFTESSDGWRVLPVVKQP